MVLKMHRINRIILILIIALLSFIGYILYDVLFMDSSWLMHVVDLGAAFTVLLVLLIVSITNRLEKKTNTPSLALALSSILFITTIAIWPNLAFSVWNYAAAFLSLFIGQSLLLLTSKGGSINKLLLLCMTLLLVSIFLFKIENSTVYSIAFCLLAITTCTCCLTLLRTKA